MKVGESAHLVAELLRGLCGECGEARAKDGGGGGERGGGLERVAWVGAGGWWWREGVCVGVQAGVQGRSAVVGGRGGTTASWLPSCSGRTTLQTSSSLVASVLVRLRSRTRCNPTSTHSSHPRSAPFPPSPPVVPLALSARDHARASRLARSTARTPLDLGPERAHAHCGSSARTRCPASDLGRERERKPAARAQLTVLCRRCSRPDNPCHEVARASHEVDPRKEGEERLDCRTPPRASCCPISPPHQPARARCCDG